MPAFFLLRARREKREPRLRDSPTARYPPPGTSPNLLLHHGERLTIRYLRHRRGTRLARIKADHAIFRRAKVPRSGYSKRDRRSRSDERSGQSTSRTACGCKHVTALARASGYRGSQNVIQQASCCGRWRARWRSSQAGHIGGISNIGIGGVISELGGI